LRDRYVGSVYFSGSQRDDEEHKTGRETARIAHHSQFGTSDLAIFGVITTNSGKYMLEGPPTQTIVGANGTVPPLETDKKGRQGNVYGRDGEDPDDPSFFCGEVVDTKRGEQIVVTESGSRYRVFPSGGEYAAGQRVTAFGTSNENINGLDGTVQSWDSVTGR